MSRYGKGYSNVMDVRGPVENRVYVGNLAWGVSWKDLKDHMRQAGNVAFADVMLEESGRSRGCGLVAYRSAEEAERAVEELHDTELMGRKIFVREDREPTGRGGGASQACRVYVGNLAWSCTWKDLKDHFRSVGEVTRADVLCEGNIEGGRSKGYGIVEFKNAEEAQAAVEQLTDTEIKGRQIFVREDREAGRPPMQSYGGWAGDYSIVPYKGGGKGGYGYGGKGYWTESAGFAKVFVGNLPFDLTWQELKDHMRPVGEVVHVEIMTDGGQPGGRSKGCGIVEFATFGAAQRAVARMHDSELGGRMILVREYLESEESYGGGYGKGKGKGGGKHKVKVTGLAEGVTWQVLKDHMRDAGNVEHVAITPSGGVVTYSSAAHAKAAVQQLNRSELSGQAIKVEEDRDSTR